LDHRPVSDEVGAEIENKSLSFSTEFDGSSISHAGGAGGIGHTVCNGWTGGLDAQPTLTISNGSAQAIILSLCIIQLLGFFGVDCGHSGFCRRLPLDSGAGGALGSV
jgi:hypothetical protein